ncbi:MAG: carbon-nitrogen family hydrolase [Limosilactobacillus gorillae]|jgi:omega-amidase|uniref:carbon-nitrogen family hydrolase n=1 Tax=Limosilactobacillus gorillae TaxID=1450649 RepID=UPI000A6099EE|nr:carbon-nitrogen family hydrolase [Limosilactobacillus gorillae]MDO4855255.1 carbon-nitrogen family hydrolase [Limosilactobacillus gorillae]
MRVAIDQLNVRLGQPDQNYQQVKDDVNKAAAMGATVVVLPEMWNTGYAFKRLDKLADVNGERTRSTLAKLAEGNGVSIVGGSVAIKRGEHFYNTTYVFNSRGQLVGHYDKVHLFGLMNEDDFISAGSEPNYFKLDGVKAVSAICYDLRFPEWLRTISRGESQVLFLPAAWPVQRIDHWRILNQARAIENQCFVVAVNQTGADSNNRFGGQSLVIDPWGKILFEANDATGLSYVDFDPEEVYSIRGSIPVFSDRRPDLYQ